VETHGRKAVYFGNQCEKNHVIAVIAPVLMDIIFLFLVSWSLFVIHSY